MPAFELIPPGSIVGVLGGGQLGRMFAIAARRMGYRVHTFSPESDTPTGQISDLEVKASYDDLDAVREFARGVRVLTFEFENVSAEAAAVAAEIVPVRPSGSVLHTTQHRLREKTFLVHHGFPCAPFRPVSSRADLDAALVEIGAPAVLKTAGFGYDGKGQVRLRSVAEADTAWVAVGKESAPNSGIPFVLEGWIDFAKEISVVAARGMDGNFAHWGVVENVHRNGILDVSVAPADLPTEIATEATRIAEGIAEQLNLVGVFCVELFVTNDGRLLVNELAPRPHNSGHFTFDASVTSQFEQQLRAICGLPLGSTRLLCPAAMVNLLGDLWSDGPPDFARACVGLDVKLHLYGKTEPRPGRKMGHITALADSTEKARRLAMTAREALIGR